MGDSVRPRSRVRVVGASPYGGSSTPAALAIGVLGAPGAAEVAPLGVRAVRYDCPAGHVLQLRLAADADVPRAWECKVHRAPAALHDPAGVAADGGRVADGGDQNTERVSKTHWEHVLERRSRAELEVLLDERLAALRARRGVSQVSGAA